MGKSGLQSVKDVCRMVAKGSLYVAGAAAIAYPVIKAGDEMLMHGKSFSQGMSDVVYYTTGYNPDSKTFSGTTFGTSVIRTGAGALAIVAARKL